MLEMLFVSGTDTVILCLPMTVSVLKSMLLSCKVFHVSGFSQPPNRLLVMFVNSFFQLRQFLTISSNFVRDECSHVFFVRCGVIGFQC